MLLKHAESVPRRDAVLEASSSTSSGHYMFSTNLLRRFNDLKRGFWRPDRCGQATKSRPTGESLESRALLSDVLGWTGGSGGTQNSAITPANISQLTQKYTDVVVGAIVAEPLVASVDITVGPNQGTQSVVFVATQRDNLYAFNLNTGELDWHTSFLIPGQTTLTPSELDFQGSGIISTPVIDSAANTMYLVSSESYGAGNVVHYIKTLHAIDMSDGLERSGSPVVIADTGYVGATAVSFAGPSVRGTGAGSVRGRVHFDVYREMQRPGLTLDGNDLLIAFGSASGVKPYYHGWLLAYNKNTLEQTGVFNVTPNGNNGGIWNDGNPIQVDSKGYLYTATGNGTFDPKLNAEGFPSRGDYGESVLKLALDPAYKGPNGFGIRVVDYFTPHNAVKLAKYDQDLASSGVLLLPDGAGGPKHPNLMVASGKLGTLYVINRSNMGRFRPYSDMVFEELPGAITSSFDTPAFFVDTVYYAGARDVLRSFSVVNGRLVPTGQGPNTFCAPWSESGGFVRWHDERHRLGDFEFEDLVRLQCHECEHRSVVGESSRILHVCDSGCDERWTCPGRCRKCAGGVRIGPVGVIARRTDRP